MKNYLPFTIFLFLIISSFSVKSQTISNEGRNFWVCFPDHSPSEDILASMSIFITSKNNSSGVVVCGDFSQKFIVEANKVIEILVPRNVSFIGTLTGISKNKGINILVDDGKPNVVVYAHVFAGFRSAATLILPYEALGSKYYSMNYTQQPTKGRNYFSQFNIVAADDNIKLNIKPVRKGVMGTPFSIILEKKGDVYQFQDTSDLTASIIEVDTLISGCKKIASFSGSTALVIGSNICDPTAAGNASLDPLFQQLYSIENWGLTFPIIPFANRNSGSIYRVIAKENNTKVLFNGQQVNLDEGKYFTSLPSTSITLLKADKPVSVAQYALTQFCADTRNTSSSSPIKSDPDMVLLNPVEFGIDRITLYSSTKLGIKEQYLNICIPTKNVNSFKINNKNFADKFSLINNFNEFSSAQILLNEIGGSNFTLIADTTFNAVAYGFGETESYAYSAGTNLKANFEVNVIKRSTKQIIKIACINENYDFQLTLPYISNKLTWTLDSIQAPIIQNNPFYKIVTLNGKKVYQYELIIDKPFKVSGIKLIKVVAKLGSTSNICSNLDEQVINFELEIRDLPQIEFSSINNTCLGNEIKFTSKQNNNEIISQWLWDFGDGKNSNIPNPSHTYTSVGSYKVKLLAISSTGCVSNVFEKIIVIDPLPNIAFEIPNTFCESKSLNFTNKSIYNIGEIKSWLWDFGDNASSIEVNSTHIYSKSGSYTIRLTAINQNGCSQVLTKSIQIIAPPTIDFDLPLSCVNDSVRFKIKNPDTTLLEFLWDFGDGSPNTIENTKQNPTHKYLNTGNYIISLKVKTSASCEVSINKTLTINGSNPITAFSIIQENNLCANQEVKIQNNSTINFGNITKLEIIYDYHSNGNNTTFTDTTPTFKEIYSFQYPKSGITKNYQILIRAYSGKLCFQESSPYSITIKGSPEIAINKTESICINNGNLVLVATESTGIIGVTKWEGKGVIENTFNPEVAGIGKHVINYTFKASNGCELKTSKEITVYSSPQVDSEKEITILLGGEKKIEANTNDIKLKYKWIPSMGLSNDSILSPIASPKETTKYTLIATSAENCSITLEVLVNVIPKPKIPNAFSPNGDGVNDTWAIKHLDTYKYVSIKIINRFGQVVFFSKPYSTPWDGKINNAEVPVGVYYYIIEPNNDQPNYTGSVTLLR